MKRFGLIFLGALAMIMAGCSKDVPQAPKEDAWVNDLSLPVPIQFGAMEFGVYTKGECITQDNAPEKADFKIWAADTSQVSQWNADAETVLLNGVDAKFSPDLKMQFVDTNGAEVKYFYPYGSKYNYSFFAYSLQTQKPDVKFEEGKGYYVDFKMGHDDVLYAYSHATTTSGKKGYNAAFIRQVYKNYATEGVLSEEGKQRVPHLQFSHLTTALNFKFTIDNSEGGFTTIPDKVTVKSLTFHGVTDNARLWIAHNRTSSVLESLSKTDSLKLEINKHITPAKLTEDLGVFFLFPQGYNYEGEDRGKISATLIVDVPKSMDAGGVSYESVSVPLDLALTRKMNNGTGKRLPFRAGEIYTIEVVMKSMVHVEVTAGINDWTNASIDEESSTGTVLE